MTQSRALLILGLIFISLLTYVGGKTYKQQDNLFNKIKKQQATYKR
jgi:hypothetical protein